MWEGRGVSCINMGDRRTREARSPTLNPSEDRATMDSHRGASYPRVQVGRQETDADLVLQVGSLVWI